MWVVLNSLNIQIHPILLFAKPYPFFFLHGEFLKLLSPNFPFGLLKGKIHICMQMCVTKKIQTA